MVLLREGVVEYLRVSGRFRGAEDRGGIDWWRVVLYPIQYCFRLDEFADQARQGDKI